MSTKVAFVLAVAGSCSLVTGIGSLQAARASAGGRLAVSAVGRAAARMSAGVPFTSALLFDCDGVLVETEELHRTAYNQAFDEFGLTVGGKPVVWTVAYYDVLQNTVGGGKPKMRYHFTQTCGGEWPAVTKRAIAQPVCDDTGMALIDQLQDVKTEFYKKLVTSGKARPGVLELMDAAIATPGIAVGICSASTRGGFEKVVDAVVGKERLAKLDVIIAGDDVQNKKPHPEIYLLAASRLGLSSKACIVVEDSLVGLRAAKAAGMRCVITYTASTEAEDFYCEGADAKLLDFGSLPPLSALFEKAAVLAELLEGARDPKPVSVKA
ncbi:HAD-like domain-containing protein [Pavlovales sp. CCMP2436]|nr:HAD-like domain-containing protein [Pavlovales sp. CCMP2436]|mmetsp:Transcript_6895/g.16583  ORF Transcript_6895/g.16583 Transcript_6895/m.16583 type:complete len:324 (-) Transcript_6895:95-1066(-)